MRASAARSSARGRFRVDRILKPAYRLEVDDGSSGLLPGRPGQGHGHGDVLRGIAGRRASRSGSRVSSRGRSRRTRPAPRRPGRRSASMPATARAANRMSRDRHVTPARAEEGEISGASREIIAFPSTWTIDATTSVVDGSVRVTGSVHAVDRDRLEREIARRRGPLVARPGGRADRRPDGHGHVHRADPVPHPDRLALRLHREEGRARLRVRTTERIGRDGRRHDRAGRDVLRLDRRAGPAHLPGRLAATDPDDTRRAGWVGPAHRPRQDEGCATSASLTLSADAIDSQTTSSASARPST